MKILSFIKWHLQKLTLDMVLWMAFCFCVSNWATSKSESMFNIAVLIFTYGFCKFGWYMIKESYQTFEKEQQGLLDTIKNSDSK